MTEECRSRRHFSCTGYVGPESDPELCECDCHGDEAQLNEVLEP